MGTIANYTWNFGLMPLPSTDGNVPAQDAPTITMVDPITQTAVKAEANKQVQTNSAPWGNTMPISIGARAVVGKIIWSSDLREVPQPESTEADNTQTPRYEVDLAISFGRPGVVPAQRVATQLINLWAQQVLCFNIDDNELTAQFNGMSVTFHSGLVDALPDATVQADKGSLTPAWRNQMYVVVKNFPLWLVGLTDGLPDFVGEIFDSVESGPGITPYTMKGGITGTNHLFSASPLLYNSKKGEAYAFILNTITDVRSLGTYDIESQTEVSRVTFPLSQGPDPSALCVHDPINNFALVESSVIFNTTPKHLINLSTGKVVYTLGKASSHLGDDVLDADPAQVQMVFKTSGDMFQTRLQGLVFNGFVLGSFLGGAVGIVWYAYDGSAMQLTDATDIGVENIQDVCCYPIVSRKDLGPGVTGVGPFALNPPLRQDAYAFLAHGSKVTLIRIGNDYPPGSSGISTRVDFHIREVVDVATFPGATVRTLFIDPSDHCLVCIWTPNDVLSVAYMTKIQITDNAYALQDPGGGTTGWRPVVGATLWQIQLPHMYDASLHTTMREMKNYPIIGYQATDNNFVEIDSATGGVRRVTAIARDGGNGFIYDGRDGSLEYINRPSNVIEHIQLHGTTNSPMPLSDIISSYMLSANYRADQFSIDSSIDDLAYGSMIDQSTDLWSLMQNLGIAYSFQYYISGSQVKFKRPAATSEGPAFTVDLSTLAANTAEPYDAVQTTFAAPSEAPGNVGITYIDKDQRYVSNTQMFRRTNFPVVLTDGDKDTNVPIPIVMKAAEALRRAAVATFAQDAQSEILSFKLPAVYLDAEPVDIIRIQVNEFVYNVLVGEIILDPDWTLSTTGANRIVNANDRFRVGADGNWVSPGGPPLIADPPLPPSKPVSTSPTDPVMLDMPLLTPADNLSNAYLNILCGAASLVKSGWTGATVSTEVGSDPWASLFHAVRSVPSGQTRDALPPTTTPFQTDTTTVITVDPQNFDPSIIVSLTDEEFRAGHNAIVVGSFGRWELIYFRDAALVDNKVQLSTLIRGCRGTEVFTDSHVQSDPLYFVCLNGQRQMLIGQGIAFGRIDETFSERARGDNFAGNITGIQVPIEGQSLKPWAPTQEAAIFGTAVNAFGTPNVGNSCGSGDRRTRITPTTSFTPTFGSLSYSVDGSLSVSLTWGWPAGLTNAVLTFDFRPSGFKQIITGMQYYSNDGSSQGNYDIEGSDDGVTWSTVASNKTLAEFFSVGNITWTNSTGYYLYRLRQVSGSTVTSQAKEFNFITMADVAANDLYITWQRRDRLGTEFVENPQPMSESAEVYDLEILSNSVIVRTVNGLTSASYVYREATQIADGFATPLTDFDVQVYQHGTNVGRGFSRITRVSTGA